MVNTNKVAIYARVSTEGQSVDAQMCDLREYCQLRKWNPTEYIDHGIGGAKESRPGWNKCWDALQKGKVKVLVVHSLDRLGRSLPHLVKIITFMTERNITLVSFRENIDLSTSSGRMLAGIFSVLLKSSTDNLFNSAFASFLRLIFIWFLKTFRKLAEVRKK